MWQRIQTLFLLIAILINGSLFLTELAVFVDGDNIENSFNISGLYAADSSDVLYSSGFLLRGGDGMSP